MYVLQLTELMAEAWTSNLPKTQLYLLFAMTLLKASYTLQMQPNLPAAAIVDKVSAKQQYLCLMPYAKKTITQIKVKALWRMLKKLSTDKGQVLN